MRLTILFIAFIMLIMAAKGQNHGIIKAIVLDSTDKKPIPYATISILKPGDSSLVSYTVTDNNGGFILRNLRQEPSRLLISHVGYPTMHLNIIFKKEEIIDLGKIYLSAKVLQEVIVKGERVPVIIKKDTIEFDAEAFKTRPNAVVEDLLRKLPGVQVNHDGHISVNGKDISKIKVDGKDFFLNDPTIATRNLDAEMIAKVQIYDNRENDPDHLIPDYQVTKIINLKFKKLFKKGSLSKFIAAAGTQDKYDGNVFYSRFDKNLQIAATANSNNLSGTGIFSDDNHGQGISGGPSSLVKSTAGSVNFDNSYGKNFKINGVYEYLDNITDNNSARQTQQFISDTIFNSNSTNLEHQHANIQSITLKAEWNPDSATILKYAPKFSYNYNSNNNNVNSINSTNYIPLLNQNNSNNYGSGSSIQFQHDLNYYHKINKKGVSLSLSNSLNINPQNNINFNNNDLLSYVASLQSDTLRRQAKTTNSNDAESLGAALHYPINKKLSADISVSGSHDRNAGDLLTYDQDLKTGIYDIFLQDQSSNLIRNDLQQNVNPVFTYQFKGNISLKAGLTTRLEQISNHFNSYSNNLNQHFFYLLPSAELHIDKVTFSYGNNVRQPSINDLQPITIVYSPLFTFIGNPNLKPIRVHNWSVNYFNFTQSQLFLNLSSNIAVETNTILREQTINAVGAQVTTPVNSKGRFTTNIYVYAGKRFKKTNKWQINTTTGINGAVGHNFFEVNQQSGYQNTQNIILNEQVSANWNDVFEIRSAYSVNYAITKYQLIDLKSTSYTTQKSLLEMDLYLPKKYTWNVNYAYSYNPLVAQGFRQNSNLLSLSFARHIQKKDKGEVRITGYDLLNQNVSSLHYASGNTINDIQYQPIRRYFLFTYTYRFSDFGK